MTTPGYPIELLRDDFTSLDTVKWTSAGSGSASAAGGQLTLDSSGGAVALQTALTYDFVSSYVAVQVVSVSDDPDTGNLSFPLVVASDAGEFLWQYVDGDLRTLGSAGYSSMVGPGFPVYLRIREQAGTIFWDYSSDGSTWTNLTSETLGSATQMVSVSMNVSPDPAPAVFVFANFNILG